RHRGFVHFIELPPQKYSVPARRVNVRFWPKADMPKNAIDVAIGGKADMLRCAVLSCGKGNETARVHRTRWRCGSVTDDGTCAAIRLHFCYTRFRPTMAWMPLLPSTNWVTRRSQARLQNT